MAINLLPRKGQYELFINRNKIFCFDDPGFEPIAERDEIHAWIRSQDSSQWSNMDEPYDRVVYYLQPELYLFFKLRWQ